MSNQIKNAIQRVCTILVLVFGLLPVAAAAEEADRAQDVRRFLQITGFDVALDSIALAADEAPAMLGAEAGDFGIVWKKMVQQVMDSAEIRETAVQMLSQTLDSDLLDHAMGFYGSDLGQRLVAAENAAHMNPDDAGTYEAGEVIVAALVRAGGEGKDRLAYYRRMTAAIDAGDVSLRAMQEVQIRFLMAAAAAGVIELTMDEPDLRALFRADEAQARADMLRGALANSAYTYQAFSDAEMLTYTEALEDARMQRVYELMNAIHYEIMATRFEMLAERMAGLVPSEEL